MSNFENEKRLNDTRQFWDHEAASFDDESEHTKNRMGRDEPQAI